MTEAEWNTCTDPVAMLDFLRSRPQLSERKARLFAVAACRSVWCLLGDERSRKAVEVAERFADGRASREELNEAHAAAHAYAEALYSDSDGHLHTPLDGGAAAAGWAAAPDAYAALNAGHDAWWAAG